MVDAPADDTEAPGHPGAVHWLAEYVYGTIATLVAVAGLTFESHPGELTTAGVVIVSAVAIWLAHTLSHLVTKRSWQDLEVSRADVWRELWTSWSIVAAAVPATLIFVLAGLHVWSIQTAFAIAEGVGVLSLAVVGIGTVGGRDRPLLRRIAYVVGLVAVGVVIVLLEAATHLL
jgi:hypothetical protein